MPNTLYAHFSLYQGHWPWPNFTPEEVSCRHCGELCLDARSLARLQQLRERWKAPIVLNSAHRCPTHNQAVGGAGASFHLALAFDCAIPAPRQEEFCALARQTGFTGIGQYPERGFVHLDLGPQRSWRG